MRTCQETPRCKKIQDRIGMPTLISKLELTDSEGQKILDHAARAYDIWKPHKGWYSIGFISVPTQFKSLIEKTYTNIVVK